MLLDVAFLWLKPVSIVTIKPTVVVADEWDSSNLH